MKKKTNRPECLYEHHDCFALMTCGKCWCLDNTDFGERDCPFYKPENEVGYEIIMKKYKEDKNE